MTVGTLARVGGHEALDFANTAGWHASEERVEHLTSYGEWLAWLRHGGDSQGQAASLVAAAAREHPARAARALGQIIEAREVIYRIFAAIAQGRPPAPADLEALHRARLMALSAAAPRWDRTGFGLSWKGRGKDLLAPLYPLVLAASE